MSVLSRIYHEGSTIKDLLSRISWRFFGGGMSVHGEGENPKGEDIKRRKKRKNK